MGGLSLVSREAVRKAINRSSGRDGSNELWRYRFMPFVLRSLNLHPLQLAARYPVVESAEHIRGSASPLLVLARVQEIACWSL
jgi:hypothetical protein